MIKYLILLVSIISLYPALAKHSKPVIGKTCMLTKSLQIDDLVNSAGKIFVGKFVSAKVSRIDGLDVRKLRFQVVEPIKGVSAKNKFITINEWARLNSPFVDKVVKDKKYVFFFYQDSARGLTSLVGLDQGFASVGKSDQLSFSKRVNLKPKRAAKLSLTSPQQVSIPAEVHTIQDLKALL